MFHYKKHLFRHGFLLLLMSSVLAGCQSTPSPKITHAKVEPRTTNERPLNVVRVSKDGVQDVQWTLTEIRNKKALYLHQFPTLTLNSASRRVTGHTGCNAVHGTYQFDISKRTLDLNVKAGFQSCDGALAQEADLATALQDIVRFELKSKQLWFYDRQGNVLIKAKSQ